MKIFLFLVFAFLALNNKAVEKMSNLARGIRNNNPMNLRITNTAWNGKVKGDDKSFETFSNPRYGIRAGAKVLLNYQSLHGLNTVDEIINRFAPPFENNTNAYAEHVASALGVGVHERIIVADNLEPLVNAIIKHENGVNPYSDETIKGGLALV